MGSALDWRPAAKPGAVAAAGRDEASGPSLLAGAERASARKREMTLGGHANPVLAGVVIAVFFGTVGYALTGQVQVECALAGALVGYVSAKAEQVIAYYFNSSSGSKQKTEIMGMVFGEEGEGAKSARRGKADLWSRLRS